MVVLCIDAAVLDNVRRTTWSVFVEWGQVFQSCDDCQYLCKPWPCIALIALHSLQGLGCCFVVRAAAAARADVLFPARLCGPGQQPQLLLLWFILSCRVGCEVALEAASVWTVAAVSTACTWSLFKSTGVWLTAKMQSLCNPLASPTFIDEKQPPIPTKGYVSMASCSAAM